MDLKRLESDSELADTSGEREKFLVRAQLGGVYSTPGSDSIENIMFLKDITDEQAHDLGGVGMMDFLEMVFRWRKSGDNPTLSICILPRRVCG